MAAAVRPPDAPRDTVDVWPTAGPPTAAKGGRQLPDVALPDYSTPGHVPPANRSEPVATAVAARSGSNG